MKTMLSGASVKRVFSSRMIRLSAWYTASNLLIRGLAFALIPIYAALLTPEQLGLVSLVLTWTGLFTVGASLYLYTVPERARADHDDPAYDRFISAITSLGILTSTAFTLILLVLPDAVFPAVFGLPKSLAVVAAAIVPASLPYRIILVRWQGESKAAVYARSSLLAEVLTAFFSIAFILVPSGFDPNFDGALGRIAGVLLVRTAFGVYFFFRTFNGVVWLPSAWRYALLYCLPLMPHALAGELLANYDRVIITQFHGAHDTGIYSVVYQVGSIVALLAATSAAAWGPWFYRQMADGNHPVVRLQLRRYILTFTGMTALLILVSPLARIVLPAVYREGVFAIPIVMAGGYFFFLHYFFLYVQTQARKTGLASLATLITAGLNVALNYALVPYIGYGAAAWITLLSYIVQFAIHAVVVRLKFKGDRVTDLRFMVPLGAVIVGLAVLVQAGL